MYYEGRLADVPDGFRPSARSDYEAGAHFEELAAKFFSTEARYRDLYTRVFPTVFEPKNEVSTRGTQAMASSQKPTQAKSTRSSAGSMRATNAVREWLLARCGEEAVDVVLLNAVNRQALVSNAAPHMGAKLRTVTALAIIPSTNSGTPKPLYQIAFAAGSRRNRRIITPIVAR